MPLNSVSIELVMLGVVVAALILLIGYVAALHSRQRIKKNNLVAISAALVDYFRRTGVEVSVSCTELAHGKRYTALVESEPMKRFRLSHIIEMTLRDHVAKACGLELEKVYWRFPIKNAASNAAAEGTAEKDAKSAEDTDEYINEGLVHYRHLPKFDVTEIPWENFEEAAAKDANDAPDTATRKDGA